MGEQLSEDQLNRVKQILNDLVKEQLTDKNEFDVPSIHNMLQNFPSVSLEAALASGTKQSYNNILDLLNRAAMDETSSTLSEAQKATAQAWNAEIQETVQLFLGLMADDRWNSRTGTPANHPDAYGVRTTKGNLNAFEAVLCMAFGGVSSKAVAIGAGSAGHVATTTDQEVRDLLFTNFSASLDNSTVVDTVTNGSGSTNIPVEGHEARATYIMLLWAKHNMPLEIFGQGAHQIPVRQVTKVDGQGNNYQQYCDEYQIVEELRTYNLWDNSTAGQNHMVSVAGALLAKSQTDKGTGRGQGKLLGGEEGLDTSILNSMHTAGSEFTMAQLGQVLKTAATVSQNMSVEALNSAYDLGYTDISTHLGLSFNISTADTTIPNNNDAAVAALGDKTQANQAIGSRLTINTSSIETPYIATIMASKYRKDFLMGLLAQADQLDVHPKSYGTAILISGMQPANTGFKENFNKGLETGTREYQGIVAGLSLINEVRGYCNQPLFTSLHEPLEPSKGYLAQHDVTGRAMDTTLLNNLTGSGVTVWGTSTQLATGLSGKQQITVLESITYGSDAEDQSRFVIGTDGSAPELGSEDLIPNKWVESNRRDVTGQVVAKILYASFKRRADLFLSSTLPTSIAYMKQPATGRNALTGQIQANMYTAFGTPTASTSAHGNIWGGAKITNFASAQPGFDVESAQVMMFMYSLLPLTDRQTFNADSVNHAAFAGQLTRILKFTPEKLQANGTTSNGKLEFFNSTTTDDKDDFQVRDSAWSGAGSSMGATATQSEFWDFSGDISQTTTAHTKDGAGADSINTVAKLRIIKAINDNLFSADAATQSKENCRLKVTNGESLDAKKLQDIIGTTGTGVFNYAEAGTGGVAAESLLVSASADLTTSLQGATTGSKLSDNSVFVKAAFASVANGLGYYEATYDATLTDKGVISVVTARSESTIKAVEIALKGSSEQQQHHFFYEVAKLSVQALEATPNDNAKVEKNTYINLAKSIINQIGYEMQDGADSKEHHLPSGWKVSDPEFSNTQNRYVLAKAVIASQSLGAFVYKYDGTTAITPTDINNINTEMESTATDYNKVQAALNADKMAMRIAQRLAGIFDKDIENNYNFEGANKPHSLTVAASELGGSYEKNILLYLAAFLFESAEEQYRLYDNETICAGFSQTTIQYIIQSSGLSESDLRTIKHGVEVEVEGVSKTNNKVVAEAHIFVAVDGGHISECTGFLDGVPQYQEVQVKFKLVSAPAGL